MARKSAHSILRCIPAPYRLVLFLIIIVLICSSIFLIYANDLSDLYEETSTIIKNVTVENLHEHVNKIDVLDDDGKPFVCPKDIQFNIQNRQHLVIILTSKLVPFVWKNFRALLCAGVDAYVMLNENFLIDSSSRADGFSARTSRHKHSYSHRFLFVHNKYLLKYGVRFMKKLPIMEFTTWDRAVVWLYHRTNLTHAWIVEHDVQWFDVKNMTYLFDQYAENSTDLLCDNLLQANDVWGQWPRARSDLLPNAHWTGTFSPMVRWSRRLLEHHYRYMQLIHPNRLKYDVHTDFRFQEFIMSTIAKIENLSIGLYNQNDSFIYIGLGDFNNDHIFYYLKHGKYILHPIKRESILTIYRTEELTKMLQLNYLVLPNVTS